MHLELIDMKMLIKEDRIVYCDDNDKPLFFYNIRMRLSAWRGRKVGWVKVKVWWCKGILQGFLWYQIRSWKALGGKEIIVDSKKVISKGGYVYLQVNISKLPLSKTECIDS